MSNVEYDHIEWNTSVVDQALVRFNKYIKRKMCPYSERKRGEPTNGAH